MIQKLVKPEGNVPSGFTNMGNESMAVLYCFISYPRFILQRCCNFRLLALLTRTLNEGRR